MRYLLQRGSRHLTQPKGVSVSNLAGQPAQPVSAFWRQTIGFRALLLSTEHTEHTEERQKVWDLELEGTKLPTPFFLRIPYFPWTISSLFGTEYEVKEIPADAPRAIRQRKQSSGRGSTLHHYPQLDEAIQRLVEADTRGDHKKPHRWILKSLSPLRAQLRAQGILASTIQRRRITITK